MNYSRPAPKIIQEAKDSIEASKPTYAEGQSGELKLSNTGFLMVALEDLPKLKHLRWVPNYFDEKKQQWVKLDFAYIQALINQSQIALLEGLRKDLDGRFEDSEDYDAGIETASLLIQAELNKLRANTPEEK